MVPTDPPSRSSQLLPRLALAIMLIAALGSLWVRWNHAETLGPEIDRAGLHYWGRSVADAPSWGLLQALNDAGQLVEHPETKLYQLLGPAYNLPTRLVNLTPVLLIGGWSQLFGTGLPAVLALGWLQTIAIALSAAVLTWKLLDGQPGRDAPIYPAVVFVSVLAHPILLVQSTWVSWHSTALMFMLGALASVPRSPRNGTYSLHSIGWPPARRVWIGLLLISALYSSYLIPPIFVGIWALVALLTSPRLPSQPGLRELAYWSCVGLALAPAALWVALQPDTTTAWLSTWSSLKLSHGLLMTKGLLITSCGLFALALAAVVVPSLEPPRLLRHGIESLMRLYLLAMTALLLVVLNAPAMDRLLLYLIPWNVLAMVAVARLRLTTERGAQFAFGGAAFSVLVGFLLTVQPAAWLAAVSPASYNAQTTAIQGQEVADALRRQAQRSSPFPLSGDRLAFRNRDIAGLIMIHLDTTGSTVTNIGRLLDALDRGASDGFLRTRALKGIVTWPLTLVGDPETEALRPRLERWFEVESRPLEELPGWTVSRLSPTWRTVQAPQQQGNL